MDGQQLVGTEIPNRLRGGFWGIVSDTAFSDVTLSEGSEGGGSFQETYTLDSMVYSVPEPSSVLGTLAFGAFGAGVVLKHKRRQKTGNINSLK